MAKQLLVDSCEFEIDRSTVVNENLPSGKVVKTISGRLSICDKRNGNGRRYPRRVWEANLKDGSSLQNLIAKNAAWGLLEHPADGKVDLSSPIAVRLVEARLTESGDVVGKIRVIGTPEGQRLQIYIEEGYNPLVSSRGYGSLKRGTDGVDDVCDDYICEGFDVVAKPSVETAEMRPESVDQHKISVVKEERLPSSPPTPAATSGKTQQQQQTTAHTMEITQIREQLSRFQDTDLAKLTPAAFAEGMSRLEKLHNEVATWASQDATRSWEATKTHADISLVETAWAAAVDRHKSSAVKLREDSVKLLKVSVAVAQTAMKYKDRLSEAIKANSQQLQLIEELARRGKGWKQRAEALSAKVATLTEDFQLATDALDIFPAKYNSDMTRMGRRVIELEFAESLTDAIKAKLKEAKHPDDILAIREMLSPKEEPKTPATTATPAAAVVSEVPKPEEKKVAESAPAAPAGAAAPAADKKLTEKKDDPRSHPSSLEEGAAMARRLSESAVAA